MCNCLFQHLWKLKGWFGLSSHQLKDSETKRSHPVRASITKQGYCLLLRRVEVCWAFQQGNCLGTRIFPMLAKPVSSKAPSGVLPRLQTQHVSDSDFPIMLGIVLKAAETVFTRGCRVGNSNQTKVKSTKSLPRAAKLMGCLTGHSLLRSLQGCRARPGTLTATRLETSWMHDCVLHTPLLTEALILGNIPKFSWFAVVMGLLPFFFLFRRRSKFCHEYL